MVLLKGDCQKHRKRRAYAQTVSVCVCVCVHIRTSVKGLSSPMDQSSLNLSVVGRYECADVTFVFVCSCSGESILFIYLVLSPVSCFSSRGAFAHRFGLEN